MTAKMGVDVIASLISNTMVQLRQKIDNDILKILQAQKGVYQVDNILSNVCLVSLNIRLWQGRKAIQLSDLAANGIDVNRLPPGSLASLGSKKTIDSEAIKCFIAYKREAITTCIKYGIKFGETGYIIPESRMNEVSASLDNLKEKFHESKNDFILKYQGEVAKWIAKNPPEWKEAISKSVDPAHVVSHAMSFNYGVYKIAAADTMFNGAEEEVNGLYGQLCKEIRALANLTLQTSYVGKKNVGQRALRPLKLIRDKIRGLECLDAELGTVANDVSDILLLVGKNKTISGKELQMITGLLANSLCNLGRKAEPEEMEEVEAAPQEEVAPIPHINFDF